MKAFSTRTRRWTIAAFTGLFVVGLATIGQADAEVIVEGNPTCEGYDFGAKVEDPSGTITIDRDGLHLTMTVGTYPDVAEPNPDNAVVSYVVHPDSDVTSGRIIVKGGNGATLYEFGEAPPLHSPVLQNGKWPTISHVQVCWNQPEEPEHGRLVVTKVVEGRGDDDKSFEVCITGPAPAETEQCQKFGPAMPAAFEILDPGEYAITETDPGGSWVVTYSDRKVTVVAGESAAVTVTNTWTEQPVLGSIEVTKAVTGDGAPTDADFEVCITGPAPATTTDCQTIAAGETATFDDLALGTYAVTETRTGLAANWTVTGEDDVVVDSDEPVTVTVTNTWTEQEQLPPVTPPTNPPVTPTEVSPSSGSLPTTGGDGTLALLQAGIAAALLAAGSVLLRLSRRPGTTTS